MAARSGLGGIDAVVLAGGAGTRLRPVLGERQKVVAEVEGIPFLSYLLAHLRDEGVRRVFLAVGFRRDEVLAYLRRRPKDSIRLFPVVEKRPLGTGGALRNALRHIRSGTILAVNGDTFASLPLGALLDFHEAKKAGAPPRARVTIAAAYRADTARYGRMDIARDGSVREYHEKGETRPGYINAGVSLIEREVLAACPAGRAFSWEREVLPGLCGRGLYAWRGRFPFLDIGTPASYRRAAAFLAKQ